MGTTSALRKQQSFVLVLAMAMALALSAQTTEATLTIVNKLPYLIALYHPPGCCSLTGFTHPLPGYGCARCPTVFLSPNKSKTLDPIVGPYPLQFLLFQGREGTYCMIGRNLKATDTLTIGPKVCGLTGRGIEAQIEMTEKPTDSPVPDPPVTFCMKLCIG